MRGKGGCDIDKYDYGISSFEGKGCVQRNLYLNCALYKRVLKGYRMVRCQVLVIGGDIGQSASGV